MKVCARTALALLALATGALAAITGSPQPPIADDEVTAIQLAEWIRDRRSGLLVVDTRPAGANTQDRLPGARPLAEFDRGAASTIDTVVVYADTRVDASIVEALRQQSRALRFLRLHGGIAAWNAEVLFPVVRSDASTRQQQRFAARAQLSRYFGGTPRRLEPGVPSGHIRSRRGC